MAGNPSSKYSYAGGQDALKKDQGNDSSNSGVSKEMLDSIYTEMLGRNADRSGIASFTGKSEDDVRDAINNSVEMRRKIYAENLLEAFDRGTKWSNEFGLDEEFTASEAGQAVFLKPGQNKADYYDFIRTDSETGLELWVDTGKETHGIVGAVSDITGVDEINDLWQQSVPNEFKAALVGYNPIAFGPSGMTAIGGTETRRDVSGVYGISESEYMEYGTAAESVAASIAAVVSGGTLWFLPALVYAGQQESARRYGTKHERDNTSWKDAAITSSAMLGAAYVGFKFDLSPAAGAAVTAGAQAGGAYATGATATEAADIGVRSYVMSYLGKRYNMSPATKAAMASLNTYSRGGDRRVKNSIQSGATTYAVASASDRYGSGNKKPITNNGEM